MFVRKLTGISIFVRVCSVVKAFVADKWRLLSSCRLCTALRKLAYSNKLKILQPKNKKFSDKNCWYFFFHISSQNIDRGYSLEPPRRGGSNEYPQSMFFSKIRKNMYTPVNPSFTIEKWGLRGSKLYRRVFVMVWADGEAIYCVHVQINISFFSSDIYIFIEIAQGHFPVVY